MNDLSHFSLFLDLELNLHVSCRMMRESWFSSTPNGPQYFDKEYKILLEPCVLFCQYPVVLEQAYVFYIRDLYETDPAVSR